MKASEDSLYEKLCLLGLLNMSFECSATKRQLEFKDIARRTALKENLVCDTHFNFLEKYSYTV